MPSLSIFPRRTNASRPWQQVTLLAICTLCASSVPWSTPVWAQPNQRPAKQSPAEPNQADEDANDAPFRLESYMLRFATAEMVAKSLEALLGEASNAKIAIDARTNRLVVLADKKTHDTIKTLLAKIDNVQPEPKTSLVKARDKAGVLRDLIQQLEMDVTIAVDAQSDTMIIRGKEEDVEYVQQLVAKLEKLFEVNQAQSLDSRQYNVELFSFGGGGEHKDAEERIHRDLTALTPVLAAKGLRQPKILAHTEVRVLSGRPFSASDGVHELSGNVEPQGNAIQLALEVSITIDEQGPPRVFETTISTREGRPVVFAMTRGKGESQPHVFAIRVTVAEE